MFKTVQKFIFSALAVSILSLGVISAASADSHQIKYRKGVMKAIGGTMGSLAAVLKGQAPAKHAVALADTMKNLSSVAVDVFPEGSDFGETGALPVIWEKPADFKTAMDAFVAAANALPAGAAAGGDAYGQAFGALGKACKGCHEHFREKKEK